MWEFAPCSPWNAIFLRLVMTPCISRSGFCQYVPGGFEIGWRQLDVAFQRLPPIGVESDVMVARAVAVRCGGAGEIQGPEPLAAQRGADELHDAWGGVFFILSDLGGQRSDVYP